MDMMLKQRLNLHVSGETVSPDDPSTEHGNTDAASNAVALWGRDN